MARTPQKNAKEWYIGVIPRRDGSDYKQNIPRVTWEDLKELVEAAGHARKYVVAIIGKINYNTENFDITGASQVVTNSTLSKILDDPKKELGKAKFYEQIQTWFALPQLPEHVTAWVVRPI